MSIITNYIGIKKNVQDYAESAIHLPLGRLTITQNNYSIWIHRARACLTVHGIMSHHAGEKRVN